MPMLEMAIPVLAMAIPVLAMLIPVLEMAMTLRMPFPIQRMSVLRSGLEFTTPFSVSNIFKSFPDRCQW